MRKMACQILFLLAVATVVTMSTSASATTDPKPLCEDFRRLLYAAAPNDLARYQLSTEGITSTSREYYGNLDIDGDDISEVIGRSCPGSTMPSDPCMLSIKLSSSGKTLEFEAWGFYLFRYRSEIFIAANADSSRKKTNIFRVNKEAVELVCPKL